MAVDGLSSVQENIRISTFNMESLDEPPRARVSLESRISALRPQLTRLRADILCLQEINGQMNASGDRRTLRALDTLLKDTIYENYHQIVTQSPSGRGVRDRHNLVILSRFPFCGSDEVHHHLIEPPLFRCSTSNPAMDKAEPVVWDRPFLFANVELDDGHVLGVLNVHLRAPRAAFVSGQKSNPHNWKSLSGWAEGFFLATVKAAGQALEVRIFLERLFDLDSKALVCVMGDFNCNDGEAPLRIICGDEEDTGSGEFAFRMLTAAERNIPESQRYSVIHRGQEFMVDHVLLSQNLMGWLHHVECHNETLHDEVGSPAAIIEAPQSYHAPVVAELTPPYKR